MQKYQKYNVGRIRDDAQRRISPAFVCGFAARTRRRNSPAPHDGLNDTQKLGRQVFAQSCGVCHLPPAINARTFGPLLSKDTAGGNDEVIRGVISEGTPRMPGFKHYLDRAEIDAIIAYLKTVPADRHPLSGSSQGETP